MYINKSSFIAKGALQYSHFSTIYPLIKRKIPFDNFEREAIDLEDGDFLEVDYIRNGNAKLLLLTHGLEGGSRQRYMLFMAKHFAEKGYDICCLNFRSCSGKMNRGPRLYHSGEINDFAYLVNILSQKYSHIELAGFSMGGNVILRYLGHHGDQINNAIKKAVVFSVPVDLIDCSDQMSKGMGKVYSEYFMRSLRKKVNFLKLNYPDLILPKPEELKNFKQFDNLITAPMFNFQNAEDYYLSASSFPVLEKIEVDTLLVNAKNDPFLGKGCFPIEKSKKHPKFHFEAPEYGGHVGFFSDYTAKEPWFVNRASEFLGN